MKKLLLFAFILFNITIAHAQYRGNANPKKIFLSIDGEVGAPSNTPYNITYGASAQAEIKLINQLGLTLAGEYIGYSYKNTLFANSNSSKHPEFIPLKAGLKYYTGPNFYLAGELGSTIQTNTNAGNMFVYAIGFGFALPINQLSDIDIGFSYQNYSQNQYQTTGLKVAYRLGW